MVILSTEITLSKLILLLSERGLLCKDRVCSPARIKGNGYTFKGDNCVKTVLAPF